MFPIIDVIRGERLYSPFNSRNREMAGNPQRGLGLWCRLDTNPGCEPVARQMCVQRLKGEKLGQKRPT